MLLALLHRWMSRPNRLPHLPLRSRRYAWLLERLEDRAVPAIAYATAQDPGPNGASTEIKVWSETGALITSIASAFPGSTNGAHVAVGDVTGDGVNDLVVGEGTTGVPEAGGPSVVLYDGAALLLGQQRVLRTFKPYNDNPATPFLGGVFLAVGDTNGDGKGDIITGAGPGGGPHVKVFSGTDNSLLASFFAYVDPNGTFWHGGVNVGAGDLGGDNGGVPGGRNGKAEIVTGVGPGGGPHVKVFDTHTDPGTVDQLASFFAYDPNFKGGVNVSAGFMTNNRDPQNFLYADFVTSPGGEPANLQTTSTAPTTKVWRLFEANNPGSSITLNGTGKSLFLYYPAASFDAFPPAFLGGVRNTTADVNGDGFDDMLVAPGPGGLPQIEAFLGQNLPETTPPAVEPTFFPQKLANPPTGFPYFAYTPVFLDPPANTQPNPDVTTGVFLG